MKVRFISKSTDGLVCLFVVVVVVVEGLLEIVNQTLF